MAEGDPDDAPDGAPEDALDDFPRRLPSVRRTKRRTNDAKVTAAAAGTSETMNGGDAPGS